MYTCNIHIHIFCQVFLSSSKNTTYTHKNFLPLAYTFCYLLLAPLQTLSRALSRSPFNIFVLSV